MDLHEVAEGITRAHIAESLAQAEQHVNERDFLGAQNALCASCCVWIPSM